MRHIVGFIIKVLDQSISACYLVWSYY